MTMHIATDMLKYLADGAETLDAVEQRLLAEVAVIRRWRDRGARLLAPVDGGYLQVGTDDPDVARALGFHEMPNNESYGDDDDDTPPTAAFLAARVFAEGVRRGSDMHGSNGGGRER